MFMLAVQQNLSFKTDSCSMGFWWKQRDLIICTMHFYMFVFITTFFLSEENSFMATFFFLKRILPSLKLLLQLTYIYMALWLRLSWAITDDAMTCVSSGDNGWYCCMSPVVINGIPMNSPSFKSISSSSPPPPPPPTPNAPVFKWPEKRSGLWWRFHNRWLFDWPSLAIN